MNLFEFLILLVIAGICGGVGGSIGGGNKSGCLGAIALGFIGALLGMWISRALKLPEFFTIQFGNGAGFPIIWSIIGASLFVALLGFFNRGKRER